MWNNRDEILVLTLTFGYILVAHTAQGLEADIRAASDDHQASEEDDCEDFHCETFAERGKDKMIELFSAEWSLSQSRHTQSLSQGRAK